MIVHRPPTSWNAGSSKTLFLAGSIEMGTAPNWQQALIDELGSREVVVLDPRRSEWDASWRQSIDEPRFREQVEWELDSLDRADSIAMWFVPETRAPITLLELGLYAASGKLVVGCPDGYWRKGNIEIVCARFGIPLVGTWVDFAAAVAARIDRLQ